MRRGRGFGGFTIVEAMVTVALFGLCVITICNLIDVSLRGVTRQHAQDSVLRNLKSVFGRMMGELREAQQIQLPARGSGNQVQFLRQNPQYDPTDPNSPKTLTVRYYLDGAGPYYTLTRESWTDPNQKCQMAIADGMESLTVTDEPSDNAVSVTFVLHTLAGRQQETFTAHRRTL